MGFTGASHTIKPLLTSFSRTLIFCSVQSWFLVEYLLPWYGGGLDCIFYTVVQLFDTCSQQCQFGESQWRANWFLCFHFCRYISWFIFRLITYCSSICSATLVVSWVLAMNEPALVMRLSSVVKSGIGTWHKYLRISKLYNWSPKHLIGGLWISSTLCIRVIWSILKIIFRDSLISRQHA